MTLSSLMRGLPGAVERLSQYRPAEVLLPQPVISEVAYGIARLPPSRKRDHLQRRFRLLLSQLRRSEWTDEVSLCFGTVKAELEERGEPLEDFDLAVAAHALARGGILVTDNVRHMGRIAGLSLESWS